MIHNTQLYTFFQWKIKLKYLTFTLTLPDTLVISPNMADIRLDLPLPTWPTTATRDFSGIDRSILK